MVFQLNCGLQSQVNTCTSGCAVMVTLTLANGVQLTVNAIHKWQQIVNQMDTKVWGPVLWRLLEDIAYGVDIAAHELTPAQKHWVLLLFESFQHALPCIYCRESYTAFFQSHAVGPPLDYSQLLQWVWQLHEMVNDKLEGQGHVVTRLPYAKLLKRMRAWTQASSASSILDIAFIVATNMPLDDIQRQQGIVHFIQALPHVLLLTVRRNCTNTKTLAQVMLKTRPDSRGFATLRDQTLHYLYKVQNHYNKLIKCPTTETFHEITLRYQQASA